MTKKETLALASITGLLCICSALAIYATHSDEIRNQSASTTFWESALLFFAETVFVIGVKAAYDSYKGNKPYAPFWNSLKNPIVNSSDSENSEDEIILWPEAGTNLGGK